MIDRIIAWSLGNRPLVLALSVIFLIGGSSVAVRMPVDVLPDLTAPTVTILVEGRGMAPTDMEALVTFPIETALNGAAGVRRVRSATAVGIAVIWIEFEWGEDIYRARQTVSERVTAVAADLPSGVDPPTLAPVSSIMGEPPSSWRSARTVTTIWRCAPSPRLSCGGGSSPCLASPRSWRPVAGNASSRWSCRPIA